MAHDSTAISGRSNIGLYIILLLGVCLRLLRIGGQKLSADEAFSWAVARRSFRGVIDFAWNDTHPPLYHLLLKATLLILPESEFGLRFFSFLCSVGTLVAVPLFVRRQWGIRAATYAGCFVALSPLDIYYAQENRMYALLGLLWVLSLILTVEMFEGKRSLVVAWSMVNIALAWTHEYGMVAVAVVMGLVPCYWLLRKTRKQGLALSGGWMGLGILLVLIGIAPVLWLEWHLRSHLGSAGTPVVPELGEIAALLKFWSAGPLPGRAEKFPPGTSLGPLLVAREYYIAPALLVIGSGVLLGLIRDSKRARSGERAGGFVLALIAIPVMLVYVYSTVTNQGIWLNRGFVGSGELVLLMGGVGISGASRLWWRRSLGAAVLALSLLSLVPYYTIWQKNYNAAALGSLPHPDERTMILITPFFSSLEVFYYLGPDTPIWALDVGTGKLGQLNLRGADVPGYAFVDCDAPILAAITDVYLYGPYDWRDPGVQRLLPACLAIKRVWMFEENGWRPKESAIRGLHHQVLHENSLRLAATLDLPQPPAPP